MNEENNLDVLVSGYREDAASPTKIKRQREEMVKTIQTQPLPEYPEISKEEIAARLAAFEQMARAATPKAQTSNGWADLAVALAPGLLGALAGAAAGGPEVMGAAGGAGFEAGAKAIGDIEQERRKLRVEGEKQAREAALKVSGDIFQAQQERKKAIFEAQSRRALENKVESVRKGTATEQDKTDIVERLSKLTPDQIKSQLSNNGRTLARYDMVLPTLETALEQLKDPAIDEGVKNSAAMSIFKLLNDPNSPDALQAAEAERVGAYATFSWVPRTNPEFMIGRNMPKFVKSAQLIVDRIKAAKKNISATNEILSKQYGLYSPPELPEEQQAAIKQKYGVVPVGQQVPTVITPQMAVQFGLTKPGVLTPDEISALKAAKERNDVNSQQVILRNALNRIAQEKLKQQQGQ